MNCAIIGTGKIGIDIYIKCKKNNLFDKVSIFNLNNKSEGAKHCIKKKFDYSDKGIDEIIKHIEKFDVLFDASSANASINHFNKIKKFLDKLHFVNLTPAPIGKFYIPYFKISNKLNSANLITCGGQSTIPLIYEINNYFKSVKYVEVVSAISSKSAGPATRANIDQYIMNTRRAIKQFTKIKDVKVIFNLNPNEPPVNMTNSVYFELTKNLNKYDYKNINRILKKINTFMKKIIKGFNIQFIGNIKDKIIKFSIEVVGNGDYLPKYSGNLDIITCVAVKYAEKIKK
jgi:acetaldehyde dehydrogenase